MKQTKETEVIQTKKFKGFFIYLLWKKAQIRQSNWNVSIRCLSDFSSCPNGCPLEIKTMTIMWPNLFQNPNVYKIIMSCTKYEFGIIIT